MTTEALLRDLSEARSKMGIALALEKIAGHNSSIPLEPLIVGYLQDKRWLIRQAAIDALGNCSDPSAPGILLETATRSTKESDLVCTNAALGRLKSEVGVEFLIQNSKHAKEDVANSALAALAKIGSRKALPCFIEALEDRRWSVKWYAMMGIEQHGDETAILPVLERVKKILSAKRLTRQSPRSELSCGLAFLWRHYWQRTEIADFFEQRLPSKLGLLTSDELSELSRLQGSSR